MSSRLTPAQITGFYQRRLRLPVGAAAGIAGNFQQESSDNAAAPGGGLDQGQGARRHGGGPAQQLEAIARELEGPERATLQALRGIRDPRRAAVVFSQRFERPGIPMNEKRQQYAVEALEAYQHAPAAAASLAAMGSPSAHQALQGVGAAAPLSSTQNATLVELLRQAVAPPSASAVASTPLARPVTSGGPEQAATGPRVPAALTPATPASSSTDAALALVGKLGQASAVPGAPQEHAADAPVGQASPQASTKLAAIVQEANHIGSAHVPYLWGGGHSGKTLPGGKVTPLDCSGAVSAALGINPKVASEFESFGAPGKGKNVTIWASSGHVLLEVNGRFWGTSHSNPGGGAGWIKPGVISQAYLRNFVPRHPGNL